MMGICSYIAPKSLYFGSKIFCDETENQVSWNVNCNDEYVECNDELLIVTMNNDVCNDGASTVTFIFIIILIYCYK